MGNFEILILQIFGAIFCCIMLYVYIEYRISLARERRIKEATYTKADVSSDSFFGGNQLHELHTSGDEILEYYLNKGYVVALDIGVLTKYPQLFQVDTPGSILITEEVFAAQKKNKVVGIYQYDSQIEFSHAFMQIGTNVSYVEKIGLDLANISDRAIGAYLYAERTDLISIIFVTLDHETQKRAIEAGLHCEII
ncbi:MULTISPECIES: hypothetical protein [unclassified Paenibacillus]|uniref:Uncharacterized protein n=1 Tax=Paenibacillus provencensis TaxID=441151 RepID=A0ABW3PXN5_9BACL|nr:MULTISPECIES: hypothetical protein [unclassified Paenibacillus]MCM3130615.1 hypothetical protein [Paenibacillus sp. MER 78]SDX74430.1 hypothetical protein SAMN05518848_11356 [Paenibacillus sp. PDC88]SFS89794.1 hypothetical protein SAMN04488601_106176 [Paenibacillus sp. 453mf]